MTPHVQVLRTRYRAGERFAPHAHAHANISLVLAGSLTERVGRTEEWAGPFDVVVKPADTVHANAYGPEGAVLLRLIVDAAWLERQDDGWSALQRWQWVRSLNAARWLLRLATLKSAPGPDLDDMVAECLAALDPTTLWKLHSKPPRWLESVCERIRDERGRGVRVATLARQAGVHPVYLARQFRRVFGCSVVEFMQAERVRHAAGALASGQEPISHIAYQAGFADQPHLTRVFQRFTGLTPARYRRLSH